MTRKDAQSVGSQRQRINKRVTSAIKKTHLHDVSSEDKHRIVSLSRGAATTVRDVGVPIQPVLFTSS